MIADDLHTAVAFARDRLPNFDQRVLDDSVAERQLADRLIEARRAAGHAEPDVYFNGFEPTADHTASLADVAREISLRQHVGGLRSGPVLVVKWPDREPQARAQRVGDGGLVFVSAGLVSLLRILSALLAASAGQILENPDLGRDASLDEVRPLAEHSLVGAVLGVDVRAEAPAWSLQGPRDRFRRQLTTFALWSVVAHECGHLFGEQRGGGSDCVAIDLRALLDARTESQVLNAQIDEMGADRFGYQTLFVDHSRAPLEHVIMVALGAALALSLQTGLYWVARGLDVSDWGWTHPVPDVRTGALIGTLDEFGLERAARRTRRLFEWSEQAFGIADARRMVQQRLDQGASQ